MKTNIIYLLLTFVVSLNAHAQNPSAFACDRYLAPHLSLRPDQAAVVHALARDPFFKKTLLSTAHLGLGPAQAQAWRTFENPAAVRAQVNRLQTGTPKYDRFVRQLDAVLGVTPDQLDELDLYPYYADEILDATVAARTLRDDQITRPRFVMRTVADLDLGDQLGDGTGLNAGPIDGVHLFGPALTWLSNPAYQMMTIRKGTRILVRFNLALMTVDKRPAIVIDGIDIPMINDDPSAPRFVESHDQFRNGLLALKNLAQAMNRDLYIFSTSRNKLVWQDICGLHHYSNPIEDDVPDHLAHGQFVYDDDAVRTCLRIPADQTLRPYYQILDANPDRPKDFVNAVVADPLITQFKTEVIGVAERADSSIKDLIERASRAPQEERDGLIKQASQKVLASPAKSSIRTLYNFPDSLTPGWQFVAKRLDQAYPSRFNRAATMSKGFPIMVDLYQVHRE